MADILKHQAARPDSLRKAVLMVKQGRIHFAASGGVNRECAPCNRKNYAGRDHPRQGNAMIVTIEPELSQRG
jgi:hypothetical protein